MYGIINKNMKIDNDLLYRKIKFDTVVDVNLYNQLSQFFGGLKNDSTELIKEKYRCTYVGELLERFVDRGITSNEHILTLLVAIDSYITNVKDVNFTFNTNQLSEFTIRVRNATSNQFIHVLSYIVDLKSIFTKPFDYEADFESFEVLLKNLTLSEIVFAKAFLLDNDEDCLNDDMKVKIFKRLVTELKLETIETSPIDVQHLILESASKEYDLFRFKKGFWKGQPYHYEFYITAWRLQKKSMYGVSLYLKPFVVWSFHMKSIMTNVYRSLPYERKKHINTDVVLKSMVEYTKDEVLDIYSLGIVGKILDFRKSPKKIINTLNQLLLEPLTDSQKRTIYYVLTITSDFLTTEFVSFNSKVINIIEPLFLATIEAEFIQISNQYRIGNYNFNGVKDYSEAFNLFSKSVGRFLRNIQLNQFVDVSLDSLKREEIEKIEKSRINYNEVFTTLEFSETRYLNTKAHFTTGDEYLQILLEKGIYDDTWETVSTLMLGALKPIIERFISKNFHLYYMNLKEQIDKKETRLFIVNHTSMDMIFDGNVTKDGVRTWIEMYLNALNEFQFHKTPSVLIELYGKVAETDLLSSEELSNLYVACRIAITHANNSKEINEIKKQYFTPIAKVIEDIISESANTETLTKRVIAQLDKVNLTRLCLQDIDELKVVFKHFASKCLYTPLSKNNFEQRIKIVMGMVNYLENHKNLMVISDSLNNRVNLYMEEHTMSIYNQSDFEFFERLLQIQSNQMEGVI